MKSISTELHAKVAALGDTALREEIRRIFGEWCWVSGEPGVKEYYALLLEESERRRNRGDPGAM